ncbi:MAG: Zn-dependent exopeptidase M28 [Ruminococcaceae bacterium]|nr:Zn-dependent exopeptidase M28 [Oscillospiraceae bacterium]
MNGKIINKILSDTAYVRYAGTEGERRCAEYLKEICSQMGLIAQAEDFPLYMFQAHTQRLVVDNEEFDCRGYWGLQGGIACGKLYYLQSTDANSLKGCKDKVVIIDNPLKPDLYHAIAQGGARGIITYSGNANLPDHDIDIKRIGFHIDGGNEIPVVNVHIKSALRLIKKQGKVCHLCLEQSRYVGSSQNIILDIAGESERQIIITAHYDTTALSVGAYDNMSGAIALLYIAEYFAKRKNRLSLRLVWCGGEELGLLGSLEYCRKHRSELKNTVLNINLDMIGSVMGEFTAFSCADEKMKDHLEAFLKKHRFGGAVHYKIRSSDSNSFVYFGVPAVSFARYAPSSLAQIHTRYDTAKILSSKSLLKDMKMITAFVEDLQCDFEDFAPISISEEIKSDVEKYMKKQAYPAWLQEVKTTDNESAL